MKWMSAEAQSRHLEDEWARLRAGVHRWGVQFIARHQRHPRHRPPLASAAEMKRAKWKMNYERDEDGRLV